MLKVCLHLTATSDIMNIGPAPSLGPVLGANLIVVATLIPTILIVILVIYLAIMKISTCEFSAYRDS